MNFYRLTGCPAVIAAAAILFSAGAATPKFHHTFDTATDASGNYTGSLCDGATLETVAGEGIVNLGHNGYFDFGRSLGEIIKDLNGDYTFTATLFIPTSTALGANGNFIFNFGNSSSAGYAFLGANETRYSISKTNWSGEQNNKVGSQFPRGEWVSVAVVQEGGNNTVYINGEKKKTSSISLHPADLGATSQNWLGRSPYSGDVNLHDARYADFRIYGQALTDAEVAEAADLEKLAALNAEAIGSAIGETVAALAFDFSDVRSDVVLPTVLGTGLSGEWTSSNPALITAQGKVNRPAAGHPDGQLTLSLKASHGNVSRDFRYPATVRAKMTDADALAFDLDNLVLPGNRDNIRSFIQLPAVTAEGSEISWKSGEPSFLSNEGRVLKHPEGTDKKEITLTATATRNGVTASRDFTVHLAAPEDYDSYLFVYFPSNSNENLYYALGTDGYKYTALNNGKCVMASDTVAIKKGIRDPHILRGEDGYFYMVATDMKSAEGWSSNRGMVLYKSKDLVNWQHSTVHFPDRFSEWKNVTRVWAPEVIWDPDYRNTDGSKGRYMIYYSLLTNDCKCPYDKVYYSYANDDFTDLLTEPEYFYDRGSATIDCDIVFNEADGLYHMFFKNEGSGGICKVTAKTLTPAEGQPAGSQWSKPSGMMQQTSEAVEGAGVFRLINSDTWVLMYDCYMNGHYQFCTSDDLENFRLKAQTATSGAFTPRHGTVIPLHPEETALLLATYPAEMPSPAINGVNNPNIRPDNLRIKDAAVYVPVKYGTDLSAFDPMFTATLGGEITPSGEQDFTGADGVTYNVKTGDKTKTYTVKAAVEANPVLPGFTADPEVMYSEKTGKFYIYPTTDGITGWGGHTFNVYSSDDLVNWRKENCILDLATSDVIWANGNAWAPSIVEKKVDGDYKYYFYFSGHNPEKNYKTLGVAVADSPVGPFRDLGRPLLTENPASGQLIDSDAFIDPVSGKAYLYWGNGYLAVAPLADDMITVGEPTVITPAGGSLSDYQFREGVNVFYRNGTYYFLWSVDDTGARNYHVAYGTSDSPMGPIQVAEQPVVIIQDSASEIYGTGHNSVLEYNGNWYIVYHRINREYVNNGPGVHREVCIDRLEFNDDGTIRKVVPTHRGIDPVNNGSSAIDDVTSDSVGGNSHVVKSFFYNVSGIFVGNRVPTETGLYIRKDVFANGRSTATKFVVR